MAARPQVPSLPDIENIEQKDVEDVLDKLARAHHDHHPQSFFPSTRIVQKDADEPFFSKRFIEQCCSDSNEEDDGYALGDDEYNAQALDLMKSTAKVSTGQYPRSQMMMPNNYL